MAFNPVDTVDTALTTLQAILGVFDRSIAIGVVNMTSFTLNLVNSDGNTNFTSGGYQNGNLPSPSIPPQTADVFGTTNTAPTTGVVGVIHYTATDLDGNDAGIEIDLNFANPFIGSDHYEQNVNVTNIPAATFSVNVIGSVGNNSQVEYVIQAAL